MDDYEEYAGVVARASLECELVLSSRPKREPALGSRWRSCWYLFVGLFVVGGNELAVFDVHFLDIVWQFEFLAIFGGIHQALHRRFQCGLRNG